MTCGRAAFHLDPRQSAADVQYRPPPPGHRSTLFSPPPPLLWLCSRVEQWGMWRILQARPADAQSSSRNPAASSWSSTSPAWPSWCSSTCWSSASASGLLSSPKGKPRSATGIRPTWRCLATGASAWLSASSPWQASNCGTRTGGRATGSHLVPFFMPVFPKRWHDSRGVYFLTAQWGHRLIHFISALAVSGKEKKKRIKFYFTYIKTNARVCHESFGYIITGGETKEKQEVITRLEINGVTRI